MAQNLDKSEQVSPADATKEVSEGSVGSTPVEELNVPEDAEKPAELEDEELKPTETDASTSGEPDTPPKNDWQAIYSPSHGAYYFFNSATNETTWVNPLQPPEADAPVPAQPEGKDNDKGKGKEIASTSTPTYLALQHAALAQGIDPALAYLDPSLLSATPGAGASSQTFTAKFNARTGAFAKPDARDPTHLSEHERAKRMSEVFFDVEKWEHDLAKGGGSIKNTTPGSNGEPGSGDKRKRPSKKDLERFKEQKKQKKLSKTAWLRE